MDCVEQVYETFLKNDAVVLFKAFTNRYILSPFSKTEFTSHLIESSSSRFVTALLIYSGLLLAVYEIVLHTGVALNLWRNPADEVFKEIPVHCAHMYVSINLLREADDDEKKEEEGEEAGKPSYLLKYPIVYHFEFSPDEYSHEEYGTDLKFIRGKVHQWFLTSEVYHHHKKDIEDVQTEDLDFYDKKGKLLQGEEQYLCHLGVDTGDTIYCVIRY